MRLKADVPMITTTVRRHSRGGDPTTQRMLQPGPTLRPFNGPLNFALTLRRYHAYGEDAANQFDGAIFRKVLRLNNDLFLLAIREDDGMPALTIHPATKNQHINSTALHHARKILGLDFDLRAFYELAKADVVLKSLVEKFHGMRPTLNPDLFEVLVTCITAQQINLQFAFTVRSRLIRRYGDMLLHRGRKYFAFPTPEKLARVRVQSLRQMQFTERKAEYIIALAKRICDGDLDLALLPHASDAEVGETLMQSRGIGRWTVDWFLARGLGRGSAFPAGDLGVAKATQHFYFNDRSQDEKTLRAFAERWGDFQNLAAHYLLAGYYFEK